MTKKEAELAAGLRDAAVKHAPDAEAALHGLMWAAIAMARNIYGDEPAALIGHLEKMMRGLPRK